MNGGSEGARALRARALRLLARREHSRVELERKLAPHVESSAALAALLDELQAKKQLSDERYAEARVHWLARKYGAVYIRDDLRAKCVPESLIERACAPDEEITRARQILKRKYRTAATTREERARRARFLQSRGFSYETIAKTLGEAD